MFLSLSSLIVANDDQDGITAMMLCAMRLESLELFAMLLDHGANIDAQDKVHLLLT